VDATAQDVLSGRAACAVECGDSLDLVRRLPAGCVDAVITDPPFGVRAEEWDRMDSHEFARFSMAWLAEARRVGKELVSFCSAYGPFRALCEMLWPRVRVMVWDKPWGSEYAGASERRLWFAHETILHGYIPERREYVSPKNRRVGELLAAARHRACLSRGGVDIALRGRKTGLCYRWEEGACLPTPEQAEKLSALLGLDGEFSAALSDACAEREITVGRAREGASEHAARGRDVFSYRTETGGSHPCQKPLPLMRELVERLTAPGALVLDPFAGSGTTGLACRQTDRRFIGVEIDPRYADIARRRLTDDAPLFATVPLAPPPAPGLFDALTPEAP
jgi:site-specific DNA-methyltransferase (adenine-specific)